MRKELSRILITLVLMIILAMAVHFDFFTIITNVTVRKWAVRLAYIVIYIIIGGEVVKEAFENIFKGELFDECFLMTVATIGAICLGDFSEALVVMFLYQCGEFFQDMAVSKSERSIERLLDIRPEFANLVTEDGKTEKVKPDSVMAGSVIRVLPGERVPIDGDVIEGKSTLDMSALTGESIPQKIEAGNVVLSGAINMSGVLEIRTSKEYCESQVSKIIELTMNASNQKSKTEKFITRFAKIYTPIVCTLALFMAVIVPLFGMLFGGKSHFLTWIYRALTFLVISCPCALVISIPLTFFAGIGIAGKNGILIKGSNYIEALSKIGVVMFDKTGTLSKGHFEVSKICTANGFAEDEMVKYVALAENFSNHPLALCIRNYCDIDNTAYKDEICIKDVQETAGYGIKAEVYGKTVLVGNLKLMQKYKINTDANFEGNSEINSEINSEMNPESNSEIKTNEGNNGTIVHVAIAGKYAGYIKLADEIKKTAPNAIKALNKMGIKDTILLTGDDESSAEYVAKRTGISKVYSKLLPGDKISVMEDIMKRTEGNALIAFVGDGINDAPSIVRADVGMAMGALGSDAAIEAADVVLMDDNPVSVSRAIRIAEKCIRIAYENIFFSIGVKLVCLILGAFGITNMWLAIFADVGVMILAVLNSLRILAFKDKTNDK